MTKITSAIDFNEQLIIFIKTSKLLECYKTHKNACISQKHPQGIDKNIKLCYYIHILNKALSEPYKYFLDRIKYIFVYLIRSREEQAPRTNLSVVTGQSCWLIATV